MSSIMTLSKEFKEFKFNNKLEILTYYTITYYDSIHILIEYQYIEQLKKTIDDLKEPTEFCLEFECDDGYNMIGYKNKEWLHSSCSYGDHTRGCNINIKITDEQFKAICDEIKSFKI